MRTLFLTLTVLTLAAATRATAQECTGNSGDPACGAPEQTGGGCGCGGGSILIAFTDQGDSYQYADDFDDDGWEDNADNAPFDFNPDQLDTDADGFGDVTDFCPGVAAPLIDGFRRQFDSDGDGLGDECDIDADGDGFDNDADNCPGVINPFLATNGGQLDVDSDGLGDACDPDDDDDGCLDAVDNCPQQAAANCQDNLAVVPDECFPDADADGIEDVRDLCIAVPDVAQADADNDGIGDACDADLDNDGIDNAIDNCAQLPNADQQNDDRDGFGNACDARLCYVVDGDEDDCLDPASPFAVKAALAEQRLQALVTGAPILLHIFANRENKAMRYTWVVVEQPADSDPTVKNPRGPIGFSRGIQYVYEADRAALFIADEPGTYVLELQAELAYGDDEGYDVRVARSRLTIAVGGESLHEGCTQTGASPWATLALAGAVLAFARRRR
jgi:MYXO-CTERM domain-containing protein